MEGLFWGFKDTLLFNKNSDQIVSILNNYKNLFYKSENNKNYPSVIGMHLTDAILELEKRGFEVFVKGDYGVVKKQYPKAGARVVKRFSSNNIYIMQNLENILLDLKVTKILGKKIYLSKTSYMIPKKLESIHYSLQ